MATHSRWLRIMITLALGHCERIDAKAEHPILMILEEFAALGYLRPVEQAAGFIAGAGVRIWSVLQDINQLKQHYKDGWETFIGNAGIVQAFSVSDLTTCKYLSEKLGDTTVETTRKEAVGTNQFRGGDTGERREFRTLPLLTPSEIAIEFARISVEGEARGGLSLVLMAGYRPFVVDRVFWGDIE
jgi:type IV secretion system protein VirD4